MPIALSRFLLGRPMRLALASMAFGALLLASWRCRAPISDILANANLLLLGLSTLLALLANYLTGLPFNDFLKQYGMDVPVWKTCYLQLVVQVTKYIPGNIWGAILQAQLMGSPRIGVVFLAGINIIAFFMSTVSTSGLALLVYDRHPFVAILVAIAGWVLASRVATSTWLPRFVSLAARFLGKSLTINVAPSPTHQIVRFFTWASLHATVQVASVITLLMATTHFDLDNILIGSASILLAWVIGTAAIVVPSGLGVREVAFVSFAAALGTSANAQSLAAIAIVARVVQTLPDILALVVVATVESTRSIRNRPRPPVH